MTRSMFKKKATMDTVLFITLLRCEDVPDQALGGLRGASLVLELNLR